MVVRRTHRVGTIYFCLALADIVSLVQIIIFLFTLLVPIT
jgi:hypothetical protein